jgi:P27 family predicted phage terminase small subunit
MGSARPGKVTAIGGRDEQAATPVPAAPDWLSNPAKELWTILAPQLPAGILAAADTTAFAMLCNALATYIEADGIVQQTGILITGPQGDLMDNPALRIRDRAAGDIQRLGSRFGMTPAERLPTITPPGDGPRRLPHLRER